MKLNIGDYCRDEKGNIDKLIDIRETIEYAPISAGAVSFHFTEKVFEKDRIKDQIIKSSPNIIDLIEVGDYVNGEIVEEVWKEIVLVGQECRPISLNNIKSIVTKEQFESMEYKIGK